MHTSSRHLVVIVLALGLGALPATASADVPAPSEAAGRQLSPPSATPVPDPPAPSRVTYIGTMAVASLFPFAMAAVMSAEEPSAGLLIGTSALFVAGGPLVHALHGQSPRVTASVLLRLGLPAAGALVGTVVYLRQDCGDCPDGPAPIAFGAAGGVLAATAVELFLAATPRPRSRPTIAPTVSPASGGLSLGLVGSF